jgi:serine/threonine-protein kinase HipA
MISDPGEAYVWVWLPGASTPVVAGRLEAVGDLLNFNYGQSYLGRDDAVPLYLPEPTRSARTGRRSARWRG